MTDNETPADNDFAQPEKAARSNEAAKYRTRLRETEAERDTLRTGLEHARQQLLSARLDPMLMKLVTLTGTPTDRIFTSDGNLDLEALEALANELDEQHPGMLSPKKGEWRPVGEAPAFQILKREARGAVAPFDPDEGKSPSNSPVGDKWKDAFTPDTR